MDIESEVAELHEELATLYRGKSQDYPQINRYWARIELLERELVKMGHPSHG